MTEISEFPKGGPEPKGFLERMSIRRQQDAVQLELKVRQIEELVSKRPRLSGPGSREQYRRIAENLFLQMQAVKTARRGNLMRALDELGRRRGKSPPTPQYFFSFVIDPNAPAEAQRDRLDRLRQDLHLYIDISKAFAAVLGQQPHEFVVRLFEGVGSLSEEISPAQLEAGEALVRITRALRLIGDGIARDQQLADYFSIVDRLSLVAEDDRGARFRYVDFDEDPDFEGRTLFACPRVVLFYKDLVVAPVEIDGACAPASGSTAVASHRVSVALVPADGPLGAESQLLIEPVTVICHGIETCEHFDVAWRDDWYVAVGADGREVRYRYPELPDFASSGFNGDDYADDLVELIPITVDALRPIISTCRALEFDRAGGALVNVTDGPVLAPRWTIAAALERRILYGPENERLAALLEADARRRWQALERWRHENCDAARDAWDACLAALSRRPDGPSGMHGGGDE